MLLVESFRISQKNRHNFFGYYDRPQSIDGIRYLYISCEDEFCSGQVRIYNSVTGEYDVLIETDAISFQLGNLNSWVGTKSVIVHKKVDGFITSHLLDIDTQEILHEWDNACYTVDSLGRYGAFFAIENSGVSRPAYGLGATEWRGGGVSVRDVRNDQLIAKLQESDLRRMLGCKSDEEVYVEHAIFGFQDELYLLVRYVNNDVKLERMVCWRFLLGSAKVISDIAKVTHYAVGSDAILFFGSRASLNKNLKLKRFLKRLPGVDWLRSSGAIRRNVLQEKYWLKSEDGTSAIAFSLDGHPTICGENFIFDTYENDEGFRQLYYLDVSTKDFYLLKNIESDPETDSTSRRCDLHPRFSKAGNVLTVDRIIGGYRCVDGFIVKENTLEDR
ncbi:hypothetical protein [Teredinibacter turnerae]|uniref:hypothetical protein n=1 Tax=Teredinibacter turnerae TaxID=2426 RepID=UPI00037989BB|nr:hypothetical protein [Teredinibacter turnerae]